MLCLFFLVPLQFVQGLMVVPISKILYRLIGRLGAIDSPGGTQQWE